MADIKTFQKEIGYQFVDSDLLIQKRENRLLKDIISSEGVDGFLNIENKVNASIDVTESVIATGGSAVYGEEAMKHLREIGTVVYLKLPLQEIADRLGDLNARGVTLREGQTLESLYEERVPLYEKYAHVIVDCHGKQLREVVALAAELVK